ncbi:MAG: relaxase/mobilization nuclease domain-containing protein [Mobilitalea sp.]
MAISKIHPIRGTLNKAIKYITNPKKTENEMYVSTFGCTRETIIEEFKFTRNLGSGIGNTLAQHVIQSFKPGEIIPEEAHTAGVELANRLTDGKHEYIIATHIDKGHIHNHIIFNQVDFLDNKKFRSNITTVKILRQLNDEICVSHGLSIIQDSTNKGMSHFEWQMRRDGISFKKRLQKNIDTCISIASTYHEFLEAMQKIGYEIKSGKYIAFRMNDQERFTRAKTLGNDYSEERIIERISEIPNVIIKEKPNYIPIYDSSIGLILNIEKHIQCIENRYYQQKVAISNVKKLAQTYNYLKTNNIDSVAALQRKEKDIKSSYSEVHDALKDIESKIMDLNEIIKYSDRIQLFKPVWTEYLETGKSTVFHEAHLSELMLFEAAIKAIKDNHVTMNNLNTNSLREDVTSLEIHRSILSERLKTIKIEQKNITTCIRNVNMILNADDHNLDAFKSKTQSNEK